MVETVVLPRGIRNNNPGNIRKDHAPDYIGIDRQRTAQEKDFLVFTSMALGLRALGVLFLAYERHDGCRTIHDFITRYAPEIENDTEAYILDVATKCRWPQNSPYPLTAPNLLLLMEAIIPHEDGVSGARLIPAMTYAAALKLIFPEGPL